MIQKLTALLLLLATFSKAHAETFTVTSNADSGPGTLREAIEKAAANGTAETDYINFNIANVSRTGRTIILLSKLPLLTTNVVIDGTTQAGLAFGKSDAKIILLYDGDPMSYFEFLAFEKANHIEIYGLYLLYSRLSPFGSVITGIWFNQSSNITIGKPGKGNYLRGMQTGISAPRLEGQLAFSSSNLVIQHTIFNNDEDGNPTTKSEGGYVNQMELAFDLFNTKSITIGGDSEAEGNTILARNIRITSIHETDYGVLKINHNRMGVPVSGAVDFQNSGGGIDIQIRSEDGTEFANLDYALQIRNNIIHGNLLLHGLSKPFSIQGNTIFKNYNANGILPSMISVEDCHAGGIIGGEAPGEGNSIFSTYNFNDSYESGSGEGGGIYLVSSPGVTVLKNEMYCNSGFYSSMMHRQINYQYKVPYVKVEVCKPNFASGKATPNSIVDVYIDDDCSACEGKVYLGRTHSNSDSTWSFSGSFSGTVTALATDATGSTSNFAAPEVYMDSIVIQHPTCGKANGSITGIRLKGTWDNVEWHSLTTNNGFLVDALISREQELHNLKPGDYYFISKYRESCKSSRFNFKLQDHTPKIDVSKMIINPASCGQASGGVYHMYITEDDYATYKWTNDGSVLMQGNASEAPIGFENLMPGNYQLVATDTLVGCEAKSPLIKISNLSGPLLNTDAVTSTNASCGASNGSIKNIKTQNVNGTAFIQWLDEDGKIAGNKIDLLNVPGGKYRLKFKDESACDTITTMYYTIGGSNKISIDASNISIMPSQCRYGSGSITGITVTGATDYEWTNEKGVVVSREKAPAALLPGTYKLTAGKATGCPKESKPVTVPVDPDMLLSPALQTTITLATCGQPNGSIVVQNFLSPSSYTFNWKATNATTIATTLNLKNAAPDAYTLFAADAAGCTQRVATATVPAAVPPVLQTNAVRLQHEVCTEHNGSIQHLSMQAGTAPFSYQWLNEQQQAVSNTIDLQNSAAGTYQLVVRDANGCITKSPLFTLTNETKPFRTPQYPDQLIPRNTSATLTPQRSEAGTYEWFADAALTQLLDKNNTGVFVTPVLPVDKTFYVRLREGTCTSGIATAIVKVADDAKVYVPTAFTPNRDGRNDDIKPLVTGIFKLEYFAIYDRWGQVVFKNGDLTKGWNGTNKGLEAPAGVYVWMLKGTDYKGNTIWQKGTVALIR